MRFVTIGISGAVVVEDFTTFYVNVIISKAVGLEKRIFKDTQPLMTNSQLLPF